MERICIMKTDEKNITIKRCVVQAQTTDRFFFVCGGECESRQKKTGEIIKVMKKEEHTC